MVLPKLAHIKRRQPGLPETGRQHHHPPLPPLFPRVPQRLQRLLMEPPRPGRGVGLLDRVFSGGKGGLLRPLRILRDPLRTQRRPEAPTASQRRSGRAHRRAGPASGLPSGSPRPRAAAPTWTGCSTPQTPSPCWAPPVAFRCSLSTTLTSSRPRSSL